LGTILLETFEGLVDFLFYASGRALLRVTGINIKDEHKKDLAAMVLGALVFVGVIGVLIFIAR